MNGHIPIGVQIPTIGQQRKAAEAAVGQAIQALSLQIYARAASEAMFETPVDADRLRQIARDSHAAARAFFEGIGVMQFEEPTDG